MCGRFTITFTLEQIEEEFDLPKNNMDWQPSYNVAPSQNSPVILQNGQKIISIYQWGLQMYIKKLNQVKMVINVRKETLIEKHSFDYLFKNNRCIIPASGFYEWEKKGVKTSPKTPFYFIKKDQKMMAFAGLWNERTDQNEKVYEFAIITCPANQIVGKLHNRMPVILDRDKQALWLSKDWSNDLNNLLTAYPDYQLDSYKVSPRINNPDYNNLDCIKPESSEQPGLGY